MTRRLKSGQCRHILSRNWKLYQLNAEKLNQDDEMRYQAVLKALNELEDKELILLYKRFHEGLILKERELPVRTRGRDPGTYPLSSRFYIDYPDTEEAAKNLELSPYHYLNLESRILRKFGKSYLKYYTESRLQHEKKEKEKQENELNELFQNHYKKSYERQEKIIGEFSKKN